MRVALVSTHRADRGHYAPLIRLLGFDKRFVVIEDFAGYPAVPTDVAVVLGDRVEMLQAAVRYVEAHVPLLHIHAGEHTYGSLDERWRWAITAIADKICAAHRDAQLELLRAGYPSILTGAPGLDDIKERQAISAPPVLVVYNPVPAGSDKEWNAITAAIAGLEAIWIEPGDPLPAGEYAVKVKTRSGMDSDQFRDHLAAARVLVGNSSSGIIEAPSLGTWAVNVGDRQRGRLRAGNVIDVPPHPEAIRAAVLDALQRPRYSGANPYAHPAGKASEAVRDALLDMAG